MRKDFAIILRNGERLLVRARDLAGALAAGALELQQGEEIVAVMDAEAIRVEATRQIRGQVEDPR